MPLFQAATCAAKRSCILRETTEPESTLEVAHDRALPDESVMLTEVVLLKESME